jgi:hypothetical protein
MTITNFNIATGDTNITHQHDAKVYTYYTQNKYFIYVYAFYGEISRNIDGDHGHQLVPPGDDEDKGSMTKEEHTTRNREMLKQGQHDIGGAYHMQRDASASSATTDDTA